MALISLMSANGSPGVTTSALGLALAWPRPCLLVEADPTGGSGVFAGYFRGESTHAEGLIDLAVSNRQGTLGDDLPKVTMTIPDTTVQFLPGIRSHTQARSLGSLWEPLTSVLRALERNGQDVIVDAGRLGIAGFADQLVEASDLALLVTRSHLPAIAGARSWAGTLTETFERNGASANLGLMVVGQGQPYGTREVSKALDLPAISSITWDPVSAEVFSRGSQPGNKFSSAQLPKSFHAATSAIGSRLSDIRASLTIEGVTHA